MHVYLFTTSGGIPVTMLMLFHSSIDMLVLSYFLTIHDYTDYHIHTTQHIIYTAHTQDIYADFMHSNSPERSHSVSKILNQ